MTGREAPLFFSGDEALATGAPGARSVDLLIDDSGVATGDVVCVFICVCVCVCVCIFECGNVCVYHALCVHTDVCAKQCRAPSLRAPFSARPC